MPKLLLTRENVHYHKECIAKLTPETKRTFGTLDAHGMICHLIFTKRMSLGEIKVEDLSNRFTRKILRKIVFEWLTTWPGGKVKAPIDVTPKPENDFETDKQRLLDYLDTFLDALDERPTDETINPALGSTPISYWSRIHGMHMNHHFRQFQID